MTPMIRLLAAASLAALVLTACKNEGAADAGAPALDTATTMPKAAPPPPTPPPPPPPPPPLTAEQRKEALYAFGVLLTQRTPVASLGKKEADIDEVMKGVNDAALNKELAVNVDEFGPKVDQMLAARREARAKEEKKAGDAFLAKAAKEKGAQKLPSGVIYVEERAGSGPNPADIDTVTVNYSGTLTDGTEFDSSYKRGQPASFPLKGVIKCWTEGVQKIKVGGKAKLVCPSDLAYGPGGRPGIPPNAVLTFEIELLSIKGK